MALLTAQALKKLETPEFTVDIGGGQEVLVRQPDMQLLVLQGHLPTPLLAEIVKMVGQWVGTPLADLTEDVIKSSDSLLKFIDEMICAAMVIPKVVRTPDEMSSESLLISDLTLATKKTIVVAITNTIAATQSEVVAAASTFHQVGPSEGSGPDVPSVQTAPVRRRRNPR